MNFAGESYWNATASATAFPQLAGDVEVDIAIVGGGIVGATAARALKDAGLTVAVVEARRVGRQVTGKSTAKITSQHSLIYQKLDKAFGRSSARLYAQAQEAGLRKIQALVKQYDIDCSFEPKSAFAYTTNAESVEQIEKELDFALEFGLPAALVHETDLPFEVAAALRFDNQAQFHPTRYIGGLVGTIPGAGSHVFEESRVVEWEPQRIRTERGSVRAKHVVFATHLPLGQVGGYYAMAHPHAEPVVAAKLRRAPNEMYISVDRPTRSIRTHRANDGSIYAIAVGNSFKPGHPQAQREAFEGLESWLKHNFDARPIEYRGSTKTTQPWTARRLSAGH
ncbi:FAD-binding oxidoreductase [Methyloceanibacter sp.]|uniref:NAD(P)/FAD-dependent oxidoreductase n=1 Tax=Methyloceanibacter sp. TaxID=1965321 RepID=UPI002C21BD2D|nr:FAD-binding oxidoreductase [Methyloceanibacter sp.]HML93030.1 FAD-binding oxidoreductase [Methyloceanibacter sp.]